MTRDRASKTQAARSAGQERARIFEALLDLCLEHGYRNLALQRVLEQTELDEAAFHRHFADLDDCVCAIYIEVREDFFEKVEAAIAEQSSWRDRLRTTAYLMLSMLRHDRRIAHLISTEIRHAGERAQRLREGIVKRLFDLLDEGREERSGANSVSRTTTDAIGGGVLMQINVAVEQGRLETGEDAIPQLMYGAVLPFLGREAAEEELRMPPPEGLEQLRWWPEAAHAKAHDATSASRFGRGAER